MQKKRERTRQANFGEDEKERDYQATKGVVCIALIEIQILQVTRKKKARKK